MPETSGSPSCGGRVFGIGYSVLGIGDSELVIRNRSWRWSLDIGHWTLATGHLAMVWDDRQSRFYNGLTTDNVLHEAEAFAQRPLGGEEEKDGSEEERRVPEFGLLGFGDGPRFVRAGRGEAPGEVGNAVCR